LDTSVSVSEFPLVLRIRDKNLMDSHLGKGGGGSAYDPPSRNFESFRMVLRGSDPLRNFFPHICYSFLPQQIPGVYVQLSMTSVKFEHNAFQMKKWRWRGLYVSYTQAISQTFPVLCRA
jgi:hypothetical protein